MNWFYKWKTSLRQHMEAVLPNINYNKTQDRKQSPLRLLWRAAWQRDRCHTTWAETVHVRRVTDPSLLLLGFPSELHADVCMYRVPLLKLGETLMAPVYPSAPAQERGDDLEVVAFPTWFTLFTHPDIPLLFLLLIQANPFLHETLLNWKASSFTRSCGKAAVALASRSSEGTNLTSFCRSRASSWMVPLRWTARWKQVGQHVAGAAAPPETKQQRGFWA